MKNNNIYSLSLQRQFENIGLDSDINQALQELKLSSMLRQSKILKQKGYSTSTLMYFMILLPFIKRKLCSFWTTEWLNQQIEAQKDTWYRFLNNERFNWRKLVTLFSLKIMFL
ncbi:MAG: hypothetical protein HQK63_01100 [Desulfamplus sp.]|nr:hypothetical protein [Desulfamplus sp.]